MLGVRHLRTKAADYRAAAKKASDDKTHDLYLSVAKYLDAWAAQAEAKEAKGGGLPASVSRPSSRVTSQRAASPSLSQAVLPAAACGLRCSVRPP
jgi:hypothetical protein